MAAQLKKVILPSYTGHAQYFPPDFCQCLFRRLARLLIGPCHRHSVGGGWRQCTPVHLAVGRARQAVQKNKAGRHHVIRQPLAQIIAECSHIRRGITKRHVGQQPARRRISGISASDNHRLHHPRKRVQRRFDLAQFNPVTANFDLLIQPSEILQIGAVRRPASPITGTVEARHGCRAVRIDDKALARQFWPVQIATGHTITANTQFARQAPRHPAAGTVQNLNPPARQRAPNHAAGRGPGLGRGDGAPCDVHCGFGDAIHVDQLRLLIAKTIEPRPETGKRQRFTTENHIAQRRADLRVGQCHTDQVIKRSRCLVQNRHLGITQQLPKDGWLPADSLRHNDQTAAAIPRAPDFPHRKIERRRMEQRPDIAGMEAE